MSRKKETYNKRQKEKKRLQQRSEKAERKEQRKANNDKGKPLAEMMVYLDENGHLSPVSPPQ
jgi:hypothetical protein